MKGAAVRLADAPQDSGSSSCGRLRLVGGRFTVESDPGGGHPSRPQCPDQGPGVFSPDGRASCGNSAASPPGAAATFRIRYLRSSRSFRLKQRCNAELEHRLGGAAGMVDDLPPSILFSKMMILFKPAVDRSA